MLLWEETLFKDRDRFELDHLPEHFLHRDDVPQAIVTWDDEVTAKFREGHVDDVGWQGVKVALGVQPKVIRTC